MPAVEGKANIDFGAGQESGREALGGAPELMCNLIREPGEAGWIHLLPGSAAWSWMPSTVPAADEIIGMTDFDGKLVYVTKGRKFYVVEAPGLVTARSDATAASQLQGADMPVFAKTKTRVICAGGGLMSSWDGTGLFAQMASGPVAGFVAANSQRLIATPYNRTGEFDWTEALETAHLTGWDPLNFAEAEARPDKAVAVFEDSNHVYIFGTETTQSFSPDPNVAFAPLSTTNVGTHAPHSIIRMPDEKLFAWFSNHKEFVVGNAHSEPKVISGPMDKTYKQIGTWTDCRGYRLRMEDMDVLLWRFPTEGVSYAFDLKSTRWISARGFNTVTGDWAPWPITAYHYWEERGLHLVGLANGEIHELSRTATTIGGQPLVGESISAFFNHGTWANEKQTTILVVPLRRGEAAFGATAPFIELAHRSDTGAWSQPIVVSLGSAGEKAPFVKKNVVGRPYRTRQWRLRVSATAGFSMGPVEETFEVLGA